MIQPLKLSIIFYLLDYTITRVRTSSLTHALGLFIFKNQKARGAGKWVCSYLQNPTNHSLSLKVIQSYPNHLQTPYRSSAQPSPAKQNSLSFCIYFVSEKLGIRKMQRSTGEVGLDYWMKWQVPVCGFIIAIPTAVAINVIKKRSTSPNWNDSILWVPCWRKLSPKWLLFYRAFASLSMAYLLYQMFLFSGLFAFYFYTQWTFTLVMIYFAIGTIVSAQGCLKSSKKAQTRNTEKDKFLKEVSEGNRSDDPLGSIEKEKGLQNRDNDCAHQEAGVLGTLMIIIYQISAGASVLTDLVFWCILVPMMAGKQFDLTLLIGFIHSLNAVFLMIDSLLNALPFQWFGFNYFILWSATYVTFQWIIHACGVTWWPYPFLELATPWAPLWYLGLALIHVPCYAVYILFVKAKNSIFSKLFRQAFVIRSQHQKAA